jgi:predicted permease
VLYRLVTPGYFSALGIPVLGGRIPTQADEARSPHVVVINQTMAAKYWPGESAIGKRVSFFEQPAKPEHWMTVIGVVGDTKQGSLATPVEIEMFAPAAQESNWFPPSHVAVRTVRDPMSVAASVRRHVRELDPLMAVTDVQPLDAIVSDSVASSRFHALLIGLFGTVAVLLAAIGVYGLLSLSVVLRRREIGVRTALGAAPRDIARLVIREGITLSAAGTAIGLAAAAGLSRGVAALLYDTEGWDPATSLIAVVGLMAIAAVACYVPARRAARLDPVVAMRQ